MTETAAGSGADDLAHALAACLANGGYADAHVSGLRKLTGGSTHDTWAFDLDYMADGARLSAPLILRRNLSTQSLDMEPQAEFALLGWLHDQGLPVAKPVYCDHEGGVLGMPFVIAQRIIGTDLRKALAQGRAGPDRRAIGAELASLQASVHAIDASQCPSGIFDPADPAGEVRRWTAPLLAGNTAASPLLRSAIAWLEANVPDVSRIAIVHGDFKANNILWSEQGRPVILDWELAHPGDPLEDLAWTMLWSTDDDIVCGLLSPDDFIAAYEIASGNQVDRHRLFYWQLYALVKLCGILRSGSGTASDADDLGPGHALLSRGSIALEAAIADYMIAIAGGVAA